MIKLLGIILVLLSIASFYCLISEPFKKIYKYVYKEDLEIILAVIVAVFFFVGLALIFG